VYVVVVLNVTACGSVYMLNDVAHRLRDTRHQSQRRPRLIQELIEHGDRLFSRLSPVAPGRTDVEVLLSQMIFGSS
jgi:hypothetical protein